MIGVQTPTPRSTRATRTRDGRPSVFLALLAIAVVAVFAVLVIGPDLPLAVSIGVCGGALGLLGLAWAVAGPRW
jgi:membrane associated rhomboid family serine protease